MFEVREGELWRRKAAINALFNSKYARKFYCVIKWDKKNTSIIIVTLSLSNLVQLFFFKQTAVKHKSSHFSSGHQALIDGLCWKNFCLFQMTSGPLAEVITKPQPINFGTEEDRERSLGETTRDMSNILHEKKLFPCLCFFLSTFSFVTLYGHL